jgi:hypothetical protein
MADDNDNRELGEMRTLQNQSVGPMEFLKFSRLTGPESQFLKFCSYELSQAKAKRASLFSVMSDDSIGIPFY